MMSPGWRCATPLSSWGNQRQLRDNTQSRGAERPSTAREGSALPQSSALCGVCGHRMTVRYDTLEQITAGHPNSRIDELLPWNCKPPSS